MKKSFTLSIFLQISVILCSLVLISSTGCNESGPARVSVHTDFGDMIIELSDSTPGHRDNFLKLASEGFYDDLLFHRAEGPDPGAKMRVRIYYCMQGRGVCF